METPETELPPNPLERINNVDEIRTAASQMERLAGQIDKAVELEKIVRFMEANPLNEFTSENIGKITTLIRLESELEEAIAMPSSTDEYKREHKRKIGLLTSEILEDFNKINSN